MTDLTPVLEDFLRGTELFPGEDIHMEVFLNPASGVLSHEEKRRSLIEFMAEHTVPREKLPSGRDVRIGINIPGDREHLLPVLDGGIARLLAAPERTDDGRGVKTVLVTAGGDGFHRDCAARLMERYAESPVKPILFRFPLGTGNDTPLITDFLEAMKLFLKGAEPVRDEIIQVDTSLGVRDYALNVVSFGLDAFVCLLTERWKGRLRGDIYKIMVDISALFYDFYHRTRISRITLFPEKDTQGGRDAESILLETRALLNVFGRRGHTNYGGGKKILPGEENHLITSMIHLPGRIILKGRFMTGSHWPGNSKIRFFRTGKMILDYPAPLLMELDGELYRLGKEDFPVTLTRRSLPFPVIN